MVLLLLVCCMVLIHTTVAQKCGYTLTRDSTPIDDYYQDGDLIIAHIGGLHRSTNANLCRIRGPYLDQQMAHALRYITEKYNSDPHILPNTTLGLLFLDTCRRSIAAVSRTMQVLTTSCNNNETNLISTNEGIDRDSVVKRPAYNIAGVIGAGLSYTSVAVNPILSAYHIPQVCYGSSLDSLSDKVAYPYFNRIGIALRFHAQAIGSLIDHFNWTYIGLLYTADTFGFNAKSEMVRLTQKRGICIGYEREVPYESGDEIYDNIIQQLLQVKTLRTIVFFTYSTAMKRLVLALNRVGAIGRFIIIFSGSFSSSTYSGFEPLFPGVFATGISQGRYGDFEKYYSQVSPWSKGENDWFGQYRPEDVNCQWGPENSNTSNCNMYQSVTDFPGFTFTKWYSWMMEAFQVYVYALHNLITSECPEAFGDTEAVRKCVDGPTLLKYIRNVQFEGITKYIEFDKNGDIYGGINLKYFRKIDIDEYKLEIIGTWNRKENQVFIDKDIEWYLTGYNSSVEGPVPESVCAHPCGVGEFYIQGELECCWECRKCRDNEYVRDDLQGCETCPMFTWPEQETVMSCEHIESAFMLWTDWLALGLEVLVSLGVLVCLYIVVIFIKYNSKKIIRGSSRELMYPIIFGMMIAYICGFAYIAKPTMASCYFTYGGFHLSCTLMFGPLFLKTLRVYRIFCAAEKLKHGVSLVDGRSQIGFTLITFLVQVFEYFSICLLSLVS